MKKLQCGYFFYRLFNKKAHYPFSGQIELTYRCNLNCIHCYCKGSEGISRKSYVVSRKSEVVSQKSEVRELTTEEWKRILDEIHREGCLGLCFTGGDPLMRKDFLEIYASAKAKGFMVTLFTNGQALTPEIINYLVKSPPSSIEITLNGITKTTYEAITQVPGSFLKVMKTIKALKEKKLPLILKSNCLKQNKHEIGRIKAFTDKFFAKLPRDRYRFKYDPLIFPRYNRDKTPCNYQLSFKEILAVKKQDPDIWKQYQESLNCKFPRLGRKRDFLYCCNAWLKQFFINPYGWMKFCDLTDKFSIDLKTTPFREGFYNLFPQLLKEQFKTNSKCRDCQLRPICYYCPARAYLETGDEEAPVPYYCRLAKAMARQMKGYH
jgi:radical SAM protein with 4Fe4S-binding SPASM domain